jgi:bifunctional non-homologous end joining protein LigD
VEAYEHDRLDGHFGVSSKSICFVGRVPRFRRISAVPAAKVEFGFNPEEKRAFLHIARQIHTKVIRGTQMVEPLLRCKIEYLEKTENGALRICTFRGF